ncbi:MAG: endonuclease [Flavobacteriales bacterium]
MRVYCLLLLFLPMSLIGQIPPGYYDSANGLTGMALKTELNNIISGHNELSYSAVKSALKDTDEDPSNASNVILLYKGTSQAKSTFGGDANDWNREHVWAKSHGGFGNSAPEGTDLHHLRPTDASVNSARGSKDFDEGGSQHSEATSCYTDSDSWEPRDEVKGDVARMLFYMAVRYEGESGEEDLELNDLVNNGSSPFHGRLSQLLLWHTEDPVDQFEEDRNNTIYTYQNNRNPFIDHESYVEDIWGAPTQISFSNLYTSPSTVYHQNDVYFSCDLELLNVAVDSVKLAWGTNGITFPNTLSTTSSSNTYTTTIAENFDENTTVYYRFSVHSSQIQTHYSAVQQFTVLEGIGLDELSFSQWAFSADQLTVFVDQLESIQVFNSFGQRLLTTKQTQIDFSAYPKGLYFILIRDERQLYKLKLVH